VEALVGQKVEEFWAMAHHPDNESILFRNVGVYASVPEVGWFTVFFE
jgi:hypothetical protein